MKSLPEKLGLKPGMSGKVVNPPANYAKLLGNWYFGGNGHGLDFIHLFVKDQADLETALPQLKSQLAPAGMLWVSWPKRASRVKTDVNENTIRDYAVGLGLVDTKVCAINDIWSGLKLVIPLKDRPKV